MISYKLNKASFVGTLLLLVSAQLSGCAASSGETAAMLRAPGVGETQFSAGVHAPSGGPGTKTDFEIKVLKELGVAYTRTQVSNLTQSDTPINASYKAYLDAGLKVLLNIYNKDPNETGTTNPAGKDKSLSGPPADINLYKTQVGKILDTYKPALVVIENEENGRYYSGTPAQYIAELQAATAVAHQKGYKVANGGITGVPLSLIVWKDYWDRELRAQADDFARRAFAPGTKAATIYSQLPTSTDPNKPFPPTVAASGYDRAKAELSALKDTDIDYVNFHWYQEDAKGFGEVADYLQRVTGKPVISNEVGSASDSPSVVTALLQEAYSRGMAYLNWFSGDVVTQSKDLDLQQVRALQNPDGSLRSTGQAFAEFIKNPATLATPVAPVPTPSSLPGTGSRTFPEAGKTVTGTFLDYWNKNGGLMQQGYPISAEMQEVSDIDGKLYKVQYFERAVFEYHPDNQPPFNVLLTLLGDLAYKQKYSGGAANQQPNGSPGSVLFQQTGRRVGGLFLQYWQMHGGLMQQGYPISDQFTEVSDLDGKPHTVQYFERAVFEYHPENQPPYNVLLSQLGTLRYRAKYQAGATTPATPTTLPVQAALKPPIKGLLNRDGPPPQAYQAVVNGFVVQANWSDLQPMQGGPIAANNAIDQAIDTARRLNSQDATLNMRIKIRVYAGINAPDWLKNLAGPPIAVTNPQNGKGGTVGRFWTDPFGQAYSELESKLASKYDSVPEILDVTISRCTTVFAEPFIRDTGDKSTVQNLLAAGFSVEADQKCQREQVDAHKVWQATRSSLSFNPYQVISASDSPSPDESFTEQMMLYCRQTLGQRCVLENNSIRWPAQGSEYSSMYAKIKALGAPITFQTATSEKIGDWRGALTFAVDEGAAAVELPAGYSKYPLDELAAFDSKLEANAP